MPRYFAVIPAAGTGSRLGGALPKQYRELAGQPLIFHAIARLCAHPSIERVCVALAPGDRRFGAYDWKAYADKLTSFEVGGDSRAATVRNALEAMSGKAVEDDWILVHDAARPCLGARDLERLIEEVGTDECGGLLAVPVADTLKRSGDGKRALRTEPRDGLWQAQTPQMFRYGLLLKALRSCDLAQVTDEAGAIEALGLQPLLVQAEATNLKVTREQDLALAQRILDDMAKRS